MSIFIQSENQVTRDQYFEYLLANKIVKTQFHGGGIIHHFTGNGNAGCARHETHAGDETVYFIYA